jgi:hypothetical protein
VDRGFENAHIQQERPAIFLPGAPFELLEQYGIETPQGLIQAPKGLLSKTAVDVYLRQFHLDRQRLHREPPAVRFEAERSNDCWQFGPVAL